MSRRKFIKRAKIKRGRILEKRRHWWVTKTPEEIRQDILDAYKAYMPLSYETEVQEWHKLTPEQRAQRLSPRIDIMICRRKFL